MFKANAPKILLTMLVPLVAAGVLQAQTASPLTSDHTSVSLSWILGTGDGSPVSPKIIASSSTYFTIDPTTVPFWLTLGAMSGTAVSGGTAVSFDANSTVTPTLSVGTYSASVHFKVSGDSDFVLPVTLAVSQAAATVSVKEAVSSAVTINWAQGSAYPTQTLTYVSSGNPVDFTLTPSSTTTTNGSVANWLGVAHASGVAYSWGTPIALTFLQAAFDTANVGDTLTGQVIVTPADGASAVTITLTINVTSPPAVITRIFPAETPVQASSPVAINVVITGTGFYNSGSGNATVVKVAGTADSNVTFVSSTTMIVVIPTSSLGSASAVAIQVQNGSSTASSTTLNVTANPIVYSTTDSASVVEAAAGTNPTIAPYEMITLFGVGFLGGDTNTFTGALDSFSRYPAVIVDNTGTATNLTVTFTTSAGAAIANCGVTGATNCNAYLLYASDTQINLFVPAEVAGNATVKFKVTYGTAVSSVYTATVAAANPGVFTTSSSGQGQGAILNQDYSANSSASSSTKAALGSTVMIFASGLGTPNSTATDAAATTAPTYPTGCVSPANYMAAVNNGTFTTGNAKPGTAYSSLDGAVILGTNLATDKFAPCMVNSGTTAVTVTIGGKSATVSYAGWVANSAAGLYQINAVVPTGITGNVPVVVTVGGTANSQAGVTLATP